MVTLAHMFKAYLPINHVPVTHQGGHMYIHDGTSWIASETRLIMMSNIYHH